MRIVLTGGGTGGHLIPFEPIIESLRSRYLQETQRPQDDLTIYFLGIVDDMTHTFFAHYDIATYHISSGKLRRYASLTTIMDLGWRLPVGIVQALWRMWRIMPDVVVSKGGYGSIPIVIAARFYRIPILLHESDAAAGLANRWAARAATTIAVSFQETWQEMKHWQPKTFVTGTPVRSRFNQVEQVSSKQTFGFAPSEIVVLVMGGSQGAEQINEVLLHALPRLILQVGIIHLTGEAHYTKISTVANELLASSSRKDYYKAYPYLNDSMAEAMAAADVIVSRAGATTLAEIARLRKPSLLIPLSGAANDHQRRNAQIYEHQGAARVLEPANLTKNIFERSLLDLVINAELQQNLAANLAAFDYGDAAKQLSDLTFKLSEGLIPVATHETTT